MTAQIKKSLTENWMVLTIFIVGIIFSTGVNYQMLSAKPDEKVVIQIVDTKIKDHRENDKDVYFKGVDGVVLKAKLENIEKSVDEIKSIVNKWK